MPYAKNHIRVNVPKMSGFDQRHRNSGTAYVGSLVPLLAQEVVPGRKHLRLPINIQLPPLVSDTYMNLKYKVEAFFVPSRLLCRSFEKFFCDFPAQVATSLTVSGTNTVFIDDVKGSIPVFGYYADCVGIDSSPGELLDYMGFKSNFPASGGEAFSMLPLIAYHLIWQEWYRNPRVQKPAFVDNLGISNMAASGDRLELISAPYTFFHEQYTPSGAGSAIVANNVFYFTTEERAKLADGHSLFHVRQRNFPLDYFTGARVSPQQGSPSGVTFDIDGLLDEQTGTVTGSGSFTISQLRAANSLQQFRERNNIPSPRLVDQVKARYGANLSDGVAQRPICIGTATYDVQSNGVLQNGGDAAGTNANPFATIGAQYGRAGVSGNDFIIDDFQVSEPGYIIVLGSLVPEVTYSTGILPMWKRYLTQGSITDMACALLQNVGDQPVYCRELQGHRPSGPQLIFGYQDRYADWMFHPNECHGLMRDGQSLSSFVLQRSFGPDSNLSLSSSFLEIPKNYLDGVMQFDSATIGLSYWYDAMVEFKETMPLAEFSIPSLQDPAYEHGHSVSLRRNGQIF